MKQAMPHAPGGSIAYTVYSYDGIGRTAAVVSPDGASTTSYYYAGNSVQVNDPAGKWKVFTMDALGNLVQVVEPDPTSPGSYYVTTYTYDIWNNLTGVSMTRPTGSQTRTFVYSGKYLQSATNPENGTVTYTYNSYNKVATKTDAKGQVVVYTYDSYARLTEVQRYPQGTNNPEDTTQRETYYYDSNPFDSSYSTNVSGRLAAVEYYGPDGYGTAGATTYIEMYNYNQAGAKIGKRLRIQRTFPYYYYQNGKGPLESANTTQYLDLNGTYSYDSEGRTTGLQYPMSGPSLTWAFDSNGRLNTMGDSGGPTDIISAATYGPSNELLTMSGQVSETRTYNSMLQLTQLVSSVYPNSVNVTYAYSATQNNGKIVSQTDNISGEQVQYTYDALNRLASAQATSNSWGQSYSYDGFGNLTAQTVTVGSAPTYSASYGANSQPWCSDANGNTGANSTRAGSSTMYYDVANRFLSSGNPKAQGGYTYGYAPGNKRVSRGVCCSSDYNGTTTMSTDEVTYWSVSGQKLATYQIGGYGGLVSFPPSAPPLTVTQTGTWYYFGSKMLKNAGGYVTADRLGSIGHFYPYGQEKPSATTNGTEKFTGYLRDAETTMDYADQRYHVPGTGRFLTPDPYKVLIGGGADLLNPATWNLYGYTSGDPINRTDPVGNDYTDIGCPVGNSWSNVDGGWDCETNYDPGDNPNNWSGTTCTSVVEVDCVADSGSLVDNGTLVNDTSVTVNDSTGNDNTNPSSISVQPVNTSSGSGGPASPQIPTDSNGVPCDQKILNRFNTQFGTNASSSIFLGQLGFGQTTVNISISFPIGTLRPGLVQPGRYGGGTLGLGSTLHVVTFVVSIDTNGQLVDSVQVHLDQGNPYIVPIGSISHLGYVLGHKAGPCP